MLLLFATAGCGTTSSSTPARIRTLQLGWHEAPGCTGATVVVDVRRLLMRPNSWSVAASVRNDTRVTLTIGRPHHPGGTEYGVLLLPTSRSSAVAKAGRESLQLGSYPACQRVLRPNEAWSGTFSGRGRLADARYVRIELGRFTTVGPAQPGVPWRFRYITDHVLRVAP